MFDDRGIKRMWGQSPSAVHRSEASAARFQPKNAPPLNYFESDRKTNLFIYSGSNNEPSPIFREKNLPDSVLQAALRAGIHFGLFDNLRAMLHVDARLSTLTLVNRMAHAKTAQCPLTLLCGSRHPSQRQRGKNHCENREFRAPHHGCPESIYQPNQSVDSLHLVPFSPPLPDNRSNKPSRIVRLNVVPRIGVGFTPMYLVPSYSIGHLGRAWTLTCNSKIRCVIVFLSGVAISHWHMSQAEFPPILCSFGVWQIMCKPQCNLVSSDCWFVPRRTAFLVASKIHRRKSSFVVFQGPFFIQLQLFLGMYCVQSARHARCSSSKPAR